MKKTIIYMAILAIAACNSGGSPARDADTGKTSSSVDSMPVVKPPVTDSNGVKITPPANDSNVVKPDTNNKR